MASLCSCTAENAATDILKEEISKSTFHGFPRVATAKALVIRFFWASIILVCVVFVGIQISGLAARFWSEEVSTSTELGGARFQFPDIFLCHTIPVAQSYLLYYKNSNNPEKYIWLKNTLEKTLSLQNDLYDKTPNIDNETSVHANWLFWETIEWSQLYDNVGHRDFQTIIKMSFDSQDTPINAEHVVTRFQRHHVYCFRIQPTLLINNRSLTTVSIMLYSDNDEDPVYKKLVSGLSNRYSSHHGVQIYFTYRNTLPSFSTHSIYIRPGYHYDIRLKMQQRKLYNGTRRHCYAREDEPYFTVPFHYEKEMQQYSIYQSCVDQVQQNVLVEKCGCYSLLTSQGFISKDILDKYPNCLNVSHFLTGRNKSGDFEKLQTRFQCLLDFQNISLFDQLTRECTGKAVCITSHYSAFWSLFKWPSRKNSVESIYENILGPYKKRKIDNQILPGWESSLIRPKINQTIDTIRSVLSNILIRRQETYSNYIYEDPQYQFISFFSDIGGSLGLFVGASILTFFEWVELFYNLLNLYFKTRREKKRRINSIGCSHNSNAEVHAQQMTTMAD